MNNEKVNDLSESCTNGSETEINQSEVVVAPDNQTDGAFRDSSETEEVSVESVSEPVPNDETSQRPTSSGPRSEEYTTGEQTRIVTQLIKVFWNFLCILDLCRSITVVSDFALIPNLDHWMPPHGERSFRDANLRQ